MEKKKAIEAMQSGSKVTHRLFLPDEWIKTNEKGQILFEDGNAVSSEVFWSHRQGKEWETGWSIYFE